MLYRISGHSCVILAGVCALPAGIGGLDSGSWAIASGLCLVASGLFYGNDAMLNRISELDGRVNDVHAKIAERGRPILMGDGTK